jgi:hypothetical protein
MITVLPGVTSAGVSSSEQLNSAVHASTVSIQASAVVTRFISI